MSSLPDDVQVEYFSWKRALFGRYDVFHVHWPEVLLRGANPLKTSIRCVMFTLLLLRVKFGRPVIVRTIHNEAPHESLDPLRRLLHRWCDRLTTLWISLSEFTEPPGDAPNRVIPHGHYKDWFSDHRRSVTDGRRIPGRVLFFGLIRPYKGIDRLIEAFAGITDPDVELRIVGRVMDERLGEQIEQACRHDDRVSAVDAYLTDDELVEELASATLVVLPFTKSSNSGSLLLALSLDRPVLAPADPLVEQISNEVGRGWVHTFERPLTSTALAAALTATDSEPPVAPPDLDLRNWERIGRLHAEAFADALQTGPAGVVCTQRR